jgi:Domain of unknown function (DUF2017)
MNPLRRVRRTRRGDYEIRLPQEERELLRSLPGQLREMLGTADPSLRRLFPPAYPDDPNHNAEYEGLVREDLTAERLQALQVLEETASARRLDEERMSGWLKALNDLRLVLGTKLDVTEDMDDDEVPARPEDAQLFLVYRYLTALQWQVVEALAMALDDVGTD